MAAAPPMESINPLPTLRKNCEIRTKDSKMLPIPGARAKECTSCRQVKLKCNLPESFPAPCSRCSAKRLECRVDANFKRVLRQERTAPIFEVVRRFHEIMLYGKLEEMTTELSTLRRVIGTQTAGRSSDPDRLSPNSGLRSRSSSAAMSSSIEESVTSSPASFLGIGNGTTHALKIGDQCLGTTIFNSSDIIQLFEYLVQPLHDLPAIHAILILCTWPITVRTQPDNPSWNYCGLITNAALHIGLHKPGQEREYGFPRATPRDIRLRSETMLQIFRLNVHFKTILGLSPTMADGTNTRTIHHLCTLTRLDRQTRSQTDISTVLATCTQQLENNRSGDAHETLIRAGCVELDDLHSTNISSWTAITLPHYITAKLFLYGWTLRNTHPDQSPADTFTALPLATRTSQRVLLYEASHTASQYMETKTDFTEGKNFKDMRAFIHLSVA